MSNIIVTVGQSLSQYVSEKDLCDSMKNMLKKDDGQEGNCDNCDIRLMRTVYKNTPSIIGSVPREGRSCSTINLMKRRLP